ncbi:MAG: hypothetical protein ABSF09_09415, partial [Candidatus Bathyarchaeia archaeon]
MSSVKTDHTAFSQVLIDSVNETLASVPSRPVSKELACRARAFLAIPEDEMPNQLDSLFTSLQNSFGLEGDEICKQIVKKMYQTTGIQFYEISGRSMIQYV